MGTYPNGTLSETLTTDEYGNATGTVKYNIGTKLWAKEIVAPSGYLMPAEAQNHYPLTVSSSDNEFKVYDTPTFDPNRLVIKKTGTNTDYIQGAIFKVDFYASNWCDSTQLKRTWYFISDSDGYVYFDDNHLLSSYGSVNSDPLYKPYGSSVYFPLGCVHVQEVKAANGYILPSGDTGRVCIFIRQGGTQIAQNGAAAGAYWGDFGANPLNTNNPKDIYRIENDAQKWIVTAENTEQGTATMKKSLPTGMNGNLEGYCFNLYRSESGTLWYGRSDANGNIYKTNASHSEVAEANRVYTFTGLEDGTYSFRELLNGKNAKTTKVRIYTSGGITASFNHTYTGSELGFDTNGDCVIGNIALTGLNGGGNLTIEIENTPLPGTMTMRKALTAGTWGSKEGYLFNVHRVADTAGSANTWYGRSDYNGNIYSTNQNHTEVSVNERVYTFDGMTDGTYSIRELMNGKDARTEKIRIYTSGGETAAFDHTYTRSDLSFENNGDCVLSNIPITGLNGGGTLTIEITNTPIYGEPFELIRDLATESSLGSAAGMLKTHIGIYFGGDDSIALDEMRAKELVAKIAAAASSGSYTSEMAALVGELNAIKQRIAEKTQKSRASETALQRMSDVTEAIDSISDSAIQYDNTLVRKLIECIRVISVHEVEIVFKGMQPRRYPLG